MCYEHTNRAEAKQSYRVWHNLQLTRSGFIVVVTCRRAWGGDWEIGPLPISPSSSHTQGSMTSQPPGASSQQSPGGANDSLHESEAKPLQATTVATYTDAHTMTVAPSPPRASYGTIVAASCGGGDSSIGSNSVGARSSRSSNGSHRRVNSLPPLKEPVRSKCQRFILLMLVRPWTRGVCATIIR